MSTLPYEPVGTRKPLAERINIRMVIFLVIVAAPFVAVLAGFIIYNGGVRHTAAGEEVDLKALGNFQFDQNGGTIKDVPPKFRALDGKKVVLDGFMFSDQSSSKTRDFQFVYNIQQCCFKGPPQVQERVYVHVPDSRKVPWIDGFARIVGTLHVKVETRDGNIVSVFTLDADKATAN